MMVLSPSERRYHLLNAISRERALTKAETDELERALRNCRFEAFALPEQPS